MFVVLIEVLNFSFFSNLDKKIESFFQGIEKRITSYKILREEEKQKNILQRLDREEKETNEAADRLS